jgi:hypothetical protein
VEYERPKTGNILGTPREVMTMTEQDLKIELVSGSSPPGTLRRWKEYLR